jgi:hypothetical protein
VSIIFTFGSINDVMCSKFDNDIGVEFLTYLPLSQMSYLA